MRVSLLNEEIEAVECFDIRPTDHLEEKIKEFKSARTVERLGHFVLIVRIGWGCCIFGLVMYGLCYASLTIFRPSHYFYLIWSFVSVLIAACGLLLASTVPVEDCDWDRVVSQKTVIRVGTSLFLMLMASLLGTLPPYTGFLMVIFAFPILFTSKMFTTWASLYFGLYFQTVWPVFIHAALYASNPQRGVLAGQPFYNLYNGNLAAAWWVVVGYVFVGENAFCVFLYYMWQRYKREEHGGTKLFYAAIYGFTGLCSSTLILEGIEITATKGDYALSYNRLSLQVGAAAAIPLITLLLIGRERVFTIAARQFDRKRSGQDGAFMADLYDMPDTHYLIKGKEYWVRRKNNEKNKTVNRSDPLYSWMKGTIIEISENEFVVIADESFQCERFDKGCACLHTQRRHTRPREKKSNDYNLPSKARSNLRCVQWDQLQLLEHELFGTGSPRQTNNPIIEMSRAVNPDERIDFFISHSWQDDNEYSGPKFKALKKIAEKFSQLHFRAPTFWLDKVCLDQQNMSDGLKALPIYISECNKLLVLAGPTYHTRLWCVWELCTMFTFAEDQTAVLDRILVKRLRATATAAAAAAAAAAASVAGSVAVDSRTERISSSTFNSLFTYSPERSATQDSAVPPVPTDPLEKLASFSLSEARCYDPNESMRLLKVIRAVGTDRFEANIREMATLLLEHSKHAATSHSSSVFASAARDSLL